ncbi:hypothetical protein D3C73_951380 [compost metagenome]
MRLSLGYPVPEQEIELLGRNQEHASDLKPVLLPEEMVVMQRQVKLVLVDDRIKSFLVEVANASRHHVHLSLGISPRGTLAWMGAAQAMAYYKGRSYVIPDDVKAVARAVLRHRLMLKTEAKISGMSGEDIVNDLLKRSDISLFNRASGGTA